ncbi:hypothetical protein ACLMJK_002034 [Lecanora helva]
MSSQHQSMLPQVPPAVPLSNGRQGHNGSYVHPSQQQPYYPGYQYSYPMRPQHQWQQYNYPASMHRGYQQYSPMTPYSMSQHIPPMRPSPQQTLSSSSIRSAQGLYSPSSNSSLQPPAPIPIPGSDPHLAPPTPPPPPSAPLPSRRIPFYPPLPWQSFEGTFPARAHRRRRKTPAPQSSRVPVQLPSRRDSLNDDERSSQATQSPNETVLPEATPDPLNLETASSSYLPSEESSTQPTTPSSAVPPQQTTPKINASGRPILPVLPIIPAIPNISIKHQPSKRTSASAVSETLSSVKPSNADHLIHAVERAHLQGGKAEDSSAVTDSPPMKATPKSWADLVRTKAAPSASAKPEITDSGIAQTNGFVPSKAKSLADALTSFHIRDSVETGKVAFLEPRGLVNTGNMCYMNSILQVLVFCVPFYDFLERIGNQAIHSFKSDTPLIDAMIMFMREFAVIDAAVSVDQLRMRLKDGELEQYGEAFIPEFVYEVIRRVPRFSSMRRGHQQDAEEFLGFLLEEMHEECNRVIKSSDNRATGVSTSTDGTALPDSGSSDSQAVEDKGWLEVGPRQRAAITRSSGAIVTESPITKIFGGKLRSEFRVPGLKNSVTLEPYQPLQLDIGAPNISNILDALKGLTKPETLHGDFNSPRGPGSTATKQVFIDTLPQVLIIHLKRFQYDSSGGTQKIWRKVGYPLELEIPKEVFPQHKRAGVLIHGRPPTYQLIGVVYHHGKNASGGHYTVDVRRQEGREWIRIDDTVIRRVRSEDVAEGGSEEDPKILAAALEQHKKDQQKGTNVYEQINTESEAQGEEDKGWSQVNGSSAPPAVGGKKRLGVADGNVTPTTSSGKMTPRGKFSVKDNKVAYILFYQRIEL